MSREPNARRRLLLVCATSRDPHLVNELRQVLEEDPMSFVPSADLLREIAICAACTQHSPPARRAGLCDAHRARWNLEACMADVGENADGSSLQRLVHGVLTSPDGGVQLLCVVHRQPGALLTVMCGAGA